MIRQFSITAICSVLVFMVTSPLSAQPFPPQSTISTTSLGQFTINVAPAFGGGTFTSPALFDPATLVAVSSRVEGGTPQANAGVNNLGVPVETFLNNALTDAGGAPAGFRTGDAAIAGTAETFLLIKDLNLTGPGFSVTAGDSAPFQQDSIGVGVSQDTGGFADDSNDFPACVWFKVFPEIEIAAPPLTLSVPKGLDLLLCDVESYDPPFFFAPPSRGQAAPQLFTENGQFFGQITVAAHGVGFGTANIAAFQQQFNDIEPLSSIANITAQLDPPDQEDFEIVSQEFIPPGGGHIEASQPTAQINERIQNQTTGAFDSRHILITVENPPPGPTIIDIDKDVLNATTEPWTDFHVEIMEWPSNGPQGGPKFVSAMDFNNPTTNITIMDDMVWFEEGTNVGPGQQWKGWLGIELPGGANGTLPNGVPVYQFHMWQNPIPEPSTMILTVMGVLGLLTRRLRKARS